MQNPFKTGDIVLTKLKGKEIQAAVSKIWKNEVQVKTTEGDLLWRTMYTVWRPGESPLAREQKTTKSIGVAVGANGSAAKSAPAAPKAKKLPRKPAKKRRAGFRVGNDITMISRGSNPLRTHFVTRCSMTGFKSAE
jgi:hypothetical protein